MSTPPLLPFPPDRYDRTFMDRFAEAIKKGFQFTILENEATTSVLLQSPAGKIYKVTVSDAGVLTTTYVSG